VVLGFGKASIHFEVFGACGGELGIENVVLREPTATP